MSKAIVIVGTGGFVGSCLRFLLGGIEAVICHGMFPLGTFMANVSGCLLIGVFHGLAANCKWFTEKHSLLLITGLCGGFTTFSSFSDEMVEMLQNGDVLLFVFYLLSSVIIGLAAVFSGVMLVRGTLFKT